MKQITSTAILNKELILKSNSCKDTKNIAGMIAKIIQKGDNIFLMGDLGAGKTFFTNCLVKELGVQDFANSPSFKLINEYSLPDFKIFHFDLYRLDEVSEILYLGWDEYLNPDNKNICVVEWAEKAKDIWPKKRIEIRFEYFFDSAIKNDFENLKNKDFTRRIIKIQKIEGD
jgi:tRNA threonylcarbamoyladenosine biosynthesis protein TsaE